MPRLTIELTQRQIESMEERARETNLVGPADAAAQVIGSVERLHGQASPAELLRQGLDGGPAIDATDPAWWQSEKAKFADAAARNARRC